MGPITYDVYRVKSMHGIPFVSNSIQSQLREYREHLCNRLKDVTQCLEQPVANRTKQPSFRKEERLFCVVLMVEHRGFEPLTPTLPV